MREIRIDTMNRITRNNISTNRKFKKLNNYERLIEPVQAKYLQLICGNKRSILVSNKK